MIRKKKLKKPSELLNIYSQQLTRGLEEKLIPIAFHIDFTYQSAKIVTIAGYVIFRNRWILEFNEIIQQEGLEVKKVKYRYHIMDKDKQLILRYDNVPHFPKIKTHPHHKHFRDKVTESTGPG